MMENPARNKKVKKLNQSARRLVKEGQCQKKKENPPRGEKEKKIQILIGKVNRYTSILTLKKRKRGKSHEDKN